MARRRLGSGDGGTGEDDVNVTPLLDIVFIMLIFFIVTSTFVKEPGIDPIRPEADTAVDKRFGTILIAISEEDEIFVNKEKVELEGVGPYVEQIVRENPKATAVIQSDVNARSRTLVEVVNAVRDTGMNDIAVSTQDS
ncbi:MAG: biopolymer transporter ExbD [Pseudomonadota bacterium]